MKLLSILVPLTLFCGTLSGHAAIASSTADFSGVQGQGGWSYGYYAGSFEPAAFTLMTHFNGSMWEVDPGMVWTNLSAQGGHPNGVITTGGRTPVEQWAVRRWTSPTAGPVTISGVLADFSSGGGNGVIARIFLGSSEVFTQPIESGQAANEPYSFNATVAIGTTIDFAMDPRAANDVADASRFTAVIVPEPGAALLFASFGSFFFGTMRLNRPRDGGAHKFGSR